MNAALPKLANVEWCDPHAMTGRYITCPECRGARELFSDTGPSGLTYPCPNCDGAGRWPELESNRG